MRLNEYQSGLKNCRSKIVVAIIAIAMIFACCFSNGGNTITAKAAGTAISALEITADMGVGWNLGNSLDSHGGNRNAYESETYWGNPKVTKELITEVKNKGFNTIRIPVTWYEHTAKQTVNGKTEYVIDSAWMDRVEEVVGYAYDQNMYVILNIHHEEGYINRADLANAYQPMSEYLTSVWRQIATRFADYDQHLIFEGMNEPRAVGTEEEWYTTDNAKFEVINKLNADFVRTVRGIDSPYQNTRLLMIPSYAASADGPMYEKVVIPNTGIDSNSDGRDDYVAVSIHAYKPYDFTMNSKTSHSEFTDAYNTSLKSTINSICNTYVKKGIPVIIGEFGASNYGYDDARIAWATAYMTYAKEAGIPCVLWDNNKDSNSDGSEAHGYVIRSAIGTGNNKWYSSGEKVVNALINVYNDPSVEWRGYAGKVAKHEALSDSNRITAFYEGGESFAFKGNLGNFKSGTELAIKYPNEAPTIELMDSSWGGWMQLGAEDVDDANKIAYYSYDYIMSAWGTGNNPLAYVKISTPSSSYVMYVINVAKEETPEPTPGITNPKMNGFSLTASGNIGINFFIDFPTAAAKIKISGATGEVNKNLSDSDKKAEYKVSYPVAAKDIGKNVTVTVYDSTGKTIAFSNTSNVSNGSYVISVSKALEIMQANTGNTRELTALVQAIYNYGAVSAEYFGADTGWVRLSASQTVYGTVEIISADKIGSKAERVSGSLPGDIVYQGASLILDNDVTVRHYFTGNLKGHMVKVNGSSVTPQAVNGTSNMYYVDIKGIGPVNFDSEHVLTVDNWTNRYSVMSYCNKALNMSGDTAIKSVVSSMYHYMMAAKAYYKQ